MSHLEGSWRFWYSSTFVPYGRSIVQTSLNIWMCNPSYNCLSQRGISENIVEYGDLQQIHYWHNLDLGRYRLLQNSLDEAKAVPCTSSARWRTALGGSGWLLVMFFEEVDWETEVWKIEMLLQSSTGWDMEKYGGKAQMLWRKEQLLARTDI